ncbi:DUF6064 family protein [Aquincola sp. J276]|uniref:DUF6064 family protein n=1 Tax=Aquincola sp. J276 TaxID=2898432 RepID=UPI0021512CBC|nr:DUF6064 family protein [Aquincola sp. J276]MCR5863836.1 DUF6064 family protein [Aquincola sp. J276]
MSEWWSYRPSDFLMFAPRTYWRLFELLNQAAWPLALLFMAAGLVLLVAAARGVARGMAAAPLLLRGGALWLALAWVHAGWAFVLQRYAPVNWAAVPMAAGFAWQAMAWLLLAAAGARALAVPPGAVQLPAPLHRRRVGGVLLMAAALLLHPLLAWASGRPPEQAELFGLAPDPTAIASLGWLLWCGPLRHALLALASWAVPVAWCLVSAATLWTLGSAQALVPAAALGLAAWLLRRGRAARRQIPADAAGL